MKRLLEELDARKSNEARALELLNSVRPIVVSEASLLRLRRRLQGDSHGRRKGPRGFRLVLAGILFITGSAGAAYGVMRFRRDNEISRDREVSGEVRLPGTSPSSKANRVSTSTSERGSEEKPGTVVARASTSNAPRPTTRAGGERAAPKAPTTDASPDPRLLHQAVEALRRMNDPKKASALLERYSRGGSGGPLEEEALALGIEAALASHDAKARVLARRYLSKYPEGRFRPLALSALGAPERAGEP